MRRSIIAATLAVATLFSSAASAQETLTPAQQAEAQAILETARNLASYGDARSDALALVMAAKMMTSVPGRVLPDAQSGAPGAGFDVETLLAKAEALAPEDATIETLVSEVREAAAEASRAVCHWEYYCYGSWCQYYYSCL